MNKIRKLSLTIIASLIAGLTTSCDDMFRDKPNNTISEPSIWSTPMLLDEFVNAWYHEMSCGFNTFVPTTALVKSASRYYMPWFGDQISIGKSDWYNAGYGDLLKGSNTEITKWVSYAWNNYLTQIQSINTLLENQSSIPDGAQKTRVLGEAHFFRAYYYYILWRLHGGVMIIDHTYDPLVYAEKFPRASYQEMVDFITSEADKAVALLPDSYDNTETGRVTRGAALMLKAKAYFWAASKVFQNKSADTPYLGFADDQSAAMSAKAKEVYDILIDEGKYSLIPIAGTTQDDIKNEYRKIFLTKNSQESILEVQHSDDGDYANKFGHLLDRYSVSPYFGGTTCAYTPTQNHVDEYGMQEGFTYDADNPYANRDYRFYANVLYDGATFRGHVMDIHTTDGVAGADLTKYGTSTSAAITNTGYYLGKFVDESQSVDYNDTYGSKQNFIIWRWAEVLLDYAEICWNLGETSTALEQINKVRARVHMPSLSSITWEDIVKERRVEMAFEETTYWDFFRYGIAEEKLNGSSNPLKKVTITAQPDGTMKYTISNVNRFPKRVRYFEQKQYYLPIPWSEIKYHGVNQNPDWTEV